MKNIIHSIDKALIVILKGILIICVFAMVLLTMYEVIGRTITKTPTNFAEELTRLAIVWCIFSGCSLAVRYGENSRLDLFVNKLPRIPQNIVEIIIHLFIIAVCIVLIKYGAAITKKDWVDRTTSLAYPHGVFYLPCPVNATLMIIYSVAHIVENVQRIVKKEEKVS